jgi:hypothetical protein
LHPLQDLSGYVELVHESFQLARLLVVFAYNYIVSVYLIASVSLSTGEKTFTDRLKLHLIESTSDKNHRCR